ncbi:hypothetical protein CPC08DRAFT_707710 [Agrocybe pediades]|nr:hypothetical protein CPC08DRAFT_707710 [Agrocybe pediades]
MRDSHKPLFIYRNVSLIACFLLFCAFVLFLLVSLSLTIIKPIYLLVLRSTVSTDLALSLATQLKFGVWGVCTGSSLEPLDGICYGPRLGYTVPSYVIKILDLNPDLVSIVEKALTTLLVLHPVACGLCLLSLLFSLFLASHAFSIFTLILAILTAIVSSTILGIDLALVIVAKSKLKDLANESIHLDIDFGNAVWMIVAAVALSWLAVIALSARACYCLGVRRHPRDRPRHGHHEHEHKHEHSHHHDENLDAEGGNRY